MSRPNTEGSSSSLFKGVLCILPIGGSGSEGWEVTFRLLLACSCYASRYGALSVVIYSTVWSAKYLDKWCVE